MLATIVEMKLRILAADDEAKKYIFSVRKLLVFQMHIPLFVLIPTEATIHQGLNAPLRTVVTKRLLKLDG